MSAAEREGVRMRSSNRKGWIQRLSARYSGRIEELVEDSVLPEEDEGEPRQTKVRTQSDRSYQVEIVGGVDPPAEWRDVSERKKSAGFDSISSDEVDNTVEKDLVDGDSWRLTERDNEALEADMKKELAELKEAHLASDEESLMKADTNGRVGKSAGEKKAKRISSPTAFPSNFTSIRTGKATEMFSERMKSIEQKNDAKVKAKVKPVIATIGRFSSAFKKFESSDERRHSFDAGTSMSEFKAQHPTVSASASIATKTNIRSPPPAQCKKLPRTPYETVFTDSQQDGDHAEAEITSPNYSVSPTLSSPSRLVRTPLDLTVVSAQDFPRISSSSRTSRAATIPLESSRVMRRARESCNAPDVVAATLLPDRADKIPHSKGSAASPISSTAPSTSVQSYTSQHSSSFEPNTTNSDETDLVPAIKNLPQEQRNIEQTNAVIEKESPHFDIDIVIQRDPLPATTSADEFSPEPATTAITLGRDEVTVMKIDSFHPNSAVSPSEVITVWDTEVPVKDTHEKVIPPTKLHVTHLSKDILPPRFPEQQICIQQPQEGAATNGDNEANLVSEHKETNERKGARSAGSKAHMEPVLVTIRPQPISQWPNPASEIRRSKSEEEQGPRQMRSSVALQPETDLFTQERVKDRTQLSTSERAIPKRKPVKYGAPVEYYDDREPEASRQQSQHNSPARRPMTAHSRPEVASASHGHTTHQKPLREPCRATTKHNTRHHHHEAADSYYSGNYQYNERRAETRNENPASLSPPVVNEKMKSTSLDDLRLLREGLVANTKSVFSPTKEPGKQYFGERTNVASVQRPPAAPEESDYTREWVESSKQALPISRTNRPHSPAREEKKDPSWFVDRQLASPPRGRAGGHRRRTRSLGRAPIKSKAILQMAKFFQDEAEMGATHRDPSISEDELQSASVIDAVESTTSHTAASKASIDDIYQQRSPAHWQSHESRSPVIRKPPVERKVEKQHIEPQNQKQNLQRQPPKAKASGIGNFINAYNELDADAQSDGYFRGPRKTLIVREEKLQHTKAKKSSSLPRVKHSSGERDTDQESVDNRPLAASAFKAFLGSDSQITPLEQSVEQAYQTSMRLDRDHRVLKEKAGNKVSARTAPMKAEPWWKQENERARQRQAAETRGKKKPVLETSASLDSLPVHQAQTNRSNESPYANYHAQVERYKAEAERNEEVEDYYAQIRKKPAAERTASLPTSAVQENQLYVQVAPPKPKRNSAYQSSNSLDDITHQQAPELPIRQEFIQPLNAEHQPEVADNRMYSDPYPASDQPPNQHFDHPNQQATEEFNRHNPSQPGPVAVERLVARQEYPTGSRSYQIEERRVYTEHVPRENRLYHKEEPEPQTYPIWDSRKYPHGSWQALSTTRPQPADHRWNRASVQPEWRPPVDYRQQFEERPVNPRYPQPVREWHDPRSDPRWQDPRQDSRYNTWSDRGEHNRSRQPLPDSRQHNTLPYPEARSNSYRMNHAHARSLERPRNGETRPDVLPAERTVDRRPRRAKSVPVTRPSQQKHSRGGETKQQKAKHPNKHDGSRLSRQDKFDEKLVKGPKPKDRSGKSKGPKEGMVKQVPQIPFDTAPMPDFIPSHYFSEQPFGTAPQTSYVPQAMQGPQFSQPQPQMTYNQLTYNQPSNQIPYGHPSTNQLPYNHQPSAHMPYNSEAYSRQHMNQRPSHQLPQDQHLANENAYNKRLAYATHAERPRPGVGVMFDPRAGATDF